MYPLYRTSLAIILSAALNVGAVRWGGAWLEREFAPVAPDRAPVQLTLFEPPPEPAPREPPPKATPKRKQPPAERPEAEPRVARREAPVPAPEPDAVEAMPVLMPEPHPEPPRANPAEERTPEPKLAPNPPPPPQDDLAFPESRPDQSALVSSVRNGIDAAKRYPRLARQAGFQGRTLLKFKLLRSGDVAELNVLESSGYEILDEAALSAVRRAAPFPGEGSKVSGQWIEVILPVVFQLR